MTTREKIVAGNWKMNGSHAANQVLLNALKQHTPNITSIVFPPFVYLSQTVELLKNTPIHFGAQSLSQYEGPGAFTGEISASMLKDLGCRYVLVGHSERRTLFGETNDIIAQKFALAQKHGLIPILCVGETLAEREAGHAESVLAAQLNCIEHFNNSIIAYEPVWAIGTGVTATPDQAQSMHAFIRQCIVKKFPAIADKISILYGGSVKACNASSLFTMPDIDGALVGGASLDAEEFLAIGKAFIS